MVWGKRLDDECGNPAVRNSRKGAKTQRSQDKEGEHSSSPLSAFASLRENSVRETSSRDVFPARARKIEVKYMLLFEQEFDIPAVPRHGDLLAYLPRALKERVGDGVVPVRFVITQSDARSYHCEMATLAIDRQDRGARPESVFAFTRRGGANAEQFNAVMLVPTGIGAEIGGHAGDAAPAARLLGAACDTLITHPNVVNASDINEIPENGLYVEGSVICRLLMGTVGLQRVRSNRVLAVIDAHEDEIFVNAAVNTVSGARASYGLDSPGVVCLDPPVKLRARFASSGRAAGRVE